MIKFALLFSVLIFNEITHRYMHIVNSDSVNRPNPF